MGAMQQHTVSNDVRFHGVGLHNGRDANVTGHIGITAIMQPDTMKAHIIRNSMLLHRPHYIVLYISLLSMHHAVPAQLRLLWKSTMKKNSKNNSNIMVNDCYRLLRPVGSPQNGP